MDTNSLSSVTIRGYFLATARGRLVARALPSDLLAGSKVDHLFPDGPLALKTGGLRFGGKSRWYS